MSAAAKSPGELIADLTAQHGEKQIIISTHSSFVANKLGLDLLADLDNGASGSQMLGHLVAGLVQQTSLRISVMGHGAADDGRDLVQVRPRRLKTSIAAGQGRLAAHR